MARCAAGMVASLSVRLLVRGTCPHPPHLTRRLRQIAQVVLGLYIVRGDNVAVVGELDEEMDASIDFSQVRAPPLKQIHH